jgi:hypothetical protein
MRRATFLLHARLNGCSKQVPGFQFPRFRLQLSATKELPTTHVRPPQYRGPSIRMGCFGFSGKADFAVEGHGSGTVDDQHDRDCSQRNNVVVDSEALMDANGKQRDQHVNRNQSGGEAR